MTQDDFYPPHEGVVLSALAAQIGVELTNAEDGNILVHSIAPVARAKKGDICYISSRKNKAELETCDASVVICTKAFRDAVPAGVAVVLTNNPQTAFAAAGAILHPTAMRPASIVSDLAGIHPSAFVDPKARLEADVVIEPLAVIGEGAEIGRGKIGRAHV